MTSRMSLEELLAALARNAALPDELAEATPPQVYTSPEFLELELDEIFNHEWFCVGREDEFASPGDYRTLTIGRDPVIVLRDRDGRLRAMSNICRPFSRAKAPSGAASPVPLSRVDLQP